MLNNTQGSLLNPELIDMPEKKLVGIKITTTLAENRTFELWQRFMKRKKEIEHSVNGELFSIQRYDANILLQSVSPQTVFEKWAAIEVTDISILPDGMQCCTLQGLYAVFFYKGIAADFPIMADMIFNKWLPHSLFCLDNRAHFELMKEGYRADDPNAEETIWVPVRYK